MNHLSACHCNGDSWGARADNYRKISNVTESFAEDHRLHDGDEELDPFDAIPSNFSAVMQTIWIHQPLYRGEVLLRP
jgi:hypothetical protein